MLFGCGTASPNALIAGAYLGGTNTRRVRRALSAVFHGRPVDGLVMTCLPIGFFCVRARRAPIVFDAGRRHWGNAGPGYALSSQNVSSRTMS